MTYELAKELKEAGFPQEGDGRREGGPFATSGTQYPPPAEEVYFPTLSELIEGYGDVEMCLYREKYVSGYCWNAYVWNDADTPVQTGTTPEEAVARLWIALNRKS